MTAPRSFAIPPAKAARVRLSHVASYPHLRALTWQGELLYASSGYRLLRANLNQRIIDWEYVAHYPARLWRNLSSSSRLSFRLFRDGFHALAALSTGHLVAAVPGAIIRLAPGQREFGVAHRITRGTRPLHIACDRRNRLFWGEYFDNPRRDEVHIYVSTDCGATWDIAYTFAPGAIRHVHNIVYDQWDDCLWVLTGDNGAECRILRASCDFRSVDTVLAGSQQTRAAALVPTADALFFASDTPSEINHVYRLERPGQLKEIAAISGSSIFGCAAGQAIFFSTMVEPSELNRGRNVRVFGSADHSSFEPLLNWEKDLWHLRYLQYGNAILPAGRNDTHFLAVSTVGVKRADLETGLWRVST